MALMLVLIYVISPVDGLPDLIPIFGYIDDALLVGLMIYYLRYGRLPGFLSWLEKKVFGNMSRNTQDRPGDHFDDETSNRQNVNNEKKYSDPYSVLGVSKTATSDEIQTAYRDAVQKYHPDKVSHLGKEFQDLAQKKFIEIQAAYEQLKMKKR